MKVIDFIKRLEEIGYDENTELTLGCFDKNGEFYYLKLDTLDGDGFCYGEDLDGEAYDKKEINVGIDVEGCKEYIEARKHEVNDVLNKVSEILYEILKTIDVYM